MSNLARAITKSKFYPHMGNEWGGYYTPSEILALVKAGARVENQMSLKYVETRVKNGDSRPCWFYFFASDNLLTMLEKGGKKDYKKFGTRAKL